MNLHIDPRTIWHGELRAKLEKLWASGLSGSIVAERLSTTRNAVLGAVNRLKLAKRPVAFSKPFLNNAHLRRSWTPERKARLAKLWKNGMPMAQIAKELGCGYYGAFSARKRFNLPKRTTGGARPGITRPRKNNGQRQPSFSTRLRRAGIEQIATDPFEGHGITIHELKPSSCRWIFNDKTYCGEKKFDGCSYCGSHAMRVYSAGARELIGVSG